MEMRKLLLWLLLVLPGLGVMGVCTLWILNDWVALQAADEGFRELVARGADLRELFIAESRQNTHRLNVFCEGVWGLLGALLVGLGIHGLVVLPRDRTYS